MTKLLLKFWPVLIPFALYLLWWCFVRKKKDAGSDTIPTWEARLWWSALVSSVVIALAVLVWTAVSSEPQQHGDYVPPRLENGTITPGHQVSD